MPTTKPQRRLFPKGDPLLSYAQVAERLDCSLSTIYRLVASGDLSPIVRPTRGRPRVPASVVEDYILSCSTTGGAQ